MELLQQIYRVDTVVTDTGKILGNLLLNQGLVNEISLLVHPVIVGNRSYNMFGDITANRKVKLMKSETLEGGFLWTVYGVAGKEK
jgi:2,5-diamino-6-(ribosylamino)-4(3H)-pyrimidinone 5'-phosphate reductase